MLRVIPLKKASNKNGVFGGNARVIEVIPHKLYALQSYETIVAAVKYQKNQPTRIYQVNPDMPFVRSRTTIDHICMFLDQYVSGYDWRAVKGKKTVTDYMNSLKVYPGNMWQVEREL